MKHAKALVAAAIAFLVLAASVASSIVNVIELPEHAEKIRQQARPILQLMAPYVGPLDWALMGLVVLLAGYGFDLHGRLWRLFQRRFLATGTSSRGGNERSETVPTLGHATPVQPASPPFAVQNLSNLSNTDLRKLVAEHAQAMRFAESNFISADRALLLGNLERHQRDDEQQKLRAQFDLHFKMRLLPLAQGLHEELLARLNISPPKAWAYETLALYGSLSGPSPVTQAASYLETLVRRLP